MLACTPQIASQDESVAAASLSTLLRLLRNVVANPGNDKFRRVQPTQALLTRCLHNTCSGPRVMSCSSFDMNACISHASQKCTAVQPHHLKQCGARVRRAGFPHRPRLQPGPPTPCITHIASRHHLGCRPNIIQRHNNLLRTPTAARQHHPQSERSGGRS